MIASSLLNHVRHELCGNGGSTLVLLILPRIWKKRYNGSDPLCTGNLAGVDHDAELHERSIDLTTTRIDDVNVVLSNRLRDAYIRLADAAFSHVGLG